jgi:hypothetical protein
MSEVLTKIEVNCETGVVAEIPLTNEELAQRIADAATYAAAQAEKTAADEAFAALKASAKSKLISGQPLTAEEADTLII